MALIFRDEVHFDPATDEAIVWADTPDNEHFKVVFGRKYVADVLKASRPRSAEYVAAIKQHLPSLLPHANEALKQGLTELNFTD